MRVVVNPDREFVKMMKEKIRENDGYCPCKLEKTDETICPCVEFARQKEPGPCHCGLFIKEND